MRKESLAESERKLRPVPDAGVLSMLGGLSTPPDLDEGGGLLAHSPDAEAETLHGYAVDGWNIQRYFGAALSDPSVAAVAESGLRESLFHAHRHPMASLDESQLYDLLKSAVTVRRAALLALREEIARRVRLLVGALAYANHIADEPCRNEKQQPNERS